MRDAQWAGAPTDGLSLFSLFSLFGFRQYLKGQWPRFNVPCPRNSADPQEKPELRAEDPPTEPIPVFSQPVMWHQLIYVVRHRVAHKIFGRQKDLGCRFLGPSGGINMM